LASCHDPDNITKENQMSFWSMAAMLKLVYDVWQSELNGYLE